MARNDLEELVFAGERAYQKMKTEYGRALERSGREPFHEDECWAEAEHLRDALDRMAVVMKRKVAVA